MDRINENGVVIVAVLVVVILLILVFFYGDFDVAKIFKVFITDKKYSIFGNFVETNRNYDESFKRNESPSDTESSLASSTGSINSTLSRKCKRDKKRKKSSPELKKESSVKGNESLQSSKETFPSNANIWPNFINQVQQNGITESKVHSMILHLCLALKDRVIHGYPFETSSGVFLFKGYAYFEKIIEKFSLAQSEYDDLNFDNITELESSKLNFGNRLKQNLVSDYKKYRKCARCFFTFNVDQNGISNHSIDRNPVNLRADNLPCFYHPLKAILHSDGNLRYLCCCRLKNEGGYGCIVSNNHIYYNLDTGLNGSLHGFAATKYMKRSPKIYGLDCEMIFTSLGFEVARVSLVNVKGEQIIDVFIKPKGRIFDLNTQYSGIFPENLEQAISFKKAQNSLLQHISSIDIIIGHSLEGDLAVLKIIHRRVIDTSLIFNGKESNLTSSGYCSPQKKGLKTLVKSYLGKDIQLMQNGHDSLEDARAAVNLILNQFSEKSLLKGRKKVAPLPTVLQAHLR